MDCSSNGFPCWDIAGKTGAMTCPKVCRERATLIEGDATFLTPHRAARHRQLQHHGVLFKHKFVNTLVIIHSGTADWTYLWVVKPEVRDQVHASVQGAGASWHWTMLCLVHQEEMPLC